MRVVLLALSLTACGRLGFDGTVEPDAAMLRPELCAPQDVGPLALTAESVIAARVTKLADGYAVALGTDTLEIYVVRVGAALAFNGQHNPMSGYRLDGIGHIADGVFVAGTTTGTGYLKLLDPSWDTYQTANSSDGLPLDPPVVPHGSGTLGMRIAIASGVLAIDEINRDGATTGVSADYAPTAVAATIAGSATKYVAIDVGDGTCEGFAVAPSGATSGRHTRAACRAPVVTTHGGGAVMVYESGADVVVAPFDATGTAATITLAGARAPRVATIEGAAWVLYTTATGAVELAAIDADATVVTTGATTVTGIYDLTASAAFWVDGTSLRVGTPCLR